MTERTQVTIKNDREIHVVRLFEAQRQQVWRAMTEAELVSQWWGRGNPLTVERLEVERGGHWRFVERAGGQAHGFEGRFREVKRPERLSQTFEWDGMPGHVVVTTTTLEPMGERCTKLTATMLFLTKEDCDGMFHSGMERGMSESYAALDRVLAKLG